MLLFHSITVELEENSSLFQPGIFGINVALVVLWVVLTLQSPRPHPCSGKRGLVQKRCTLVRAARATAFQINMIFTLIISRACVCISEKVAAYSSHDSRLHWDPHPGNFHCCLTVFWWNSNVIGQMVMSHFTLRADFIWTRWGAKSNERGDRKATGLFLKDNVPQETGEENVCCRMGAVVSTDDSNSQLCNYKFICRDGCRPQTLFHLPKIHWKKRLAVRSALCTVRQNK